MFIRPATNAIYLRPSFSSNFELPSRAVLADYLSTLGLEGEFRDFLWL